MRVTSDIPSKSFVLWTDDLTEALKAEWNKHPFVADIANIIGVSKNAVLGKARRLGLPAWDGVCKGGNKQGKRPRLKLSPEEKWKRRLAQISAAKHARKGTTPKPKRELPHVVEPTSDTNCGLAALTWKTCKWPIGEPKGFDTLFCGAPTACRSYCGYHFVKGHMFGSGG